MLKQSGPAVWKLELLVVIARQNFLEGSATFSSIFKYLKVFS